MTHDEPDLDPREANLAPNVERGGGELRGTIDAPTILAGLLVAVVMGASYPYIVLKLGFGPNVSVVAAFFGFLLLKLFAGSSYSRWQNNLTEAAGTSAAQTAFMCILLAGFDLLHHSRPDIFSMTLTPLDSFLWLSAAGTLGVLLAVPLRRHFIVDENLPFPDGIAAGETLIVLDPPRGAAPAVQRAAIAAFWAMMLGIAASGLVMLFNEDTHLLPLIDKGLERLPGLADRVLPSLPSGWDVPWIAGPVVFAQLGVGAQYSLLSVGSGMIVGLRVNLSMLLGSVLAWVIAPLLLSHYAVPIHHPDSSPRNDVLFWVMWPATGMLVCSGLTALALRWRMLVDTFASLRGAKIGSHELSLGVVGVGAVVCTIALCIVQRTVLGMPVWMTLAATVLSLPLMLVGLRVLGETNWGPISALSNMMQGVFGAIAPGNVAMNMVASGTTGTIATSSEAIMQDYRAGELLGAKPRNITIMQLLAVPIGAAAVSWMYPLLVKTFGLWDRTINGKLEKAQLSSPVSQKWSGFAQILKDGWHALPVSALYALAIFSVLGVVLTVLESRPKLKKWVPSPTGVGIGILVAFNVIFTMVLGGIIGTLWEKRSKATSDIYMMPLASGLIAGEALVAVIAAVVLGLSGG